jgi:hypothetical protein
MGRRDRKRIKRFIPKFQQKKIKALADESIEAMCCSVQKAGATHEALFDFLDKNLGTDYKWCS